MKAALTLLANITSLYSSSDIQHHVSYQYAPDHNFDLDHRGTCQQRWKIRNTQPTIFKSMQSKALLFHFLWVVYSINIGIQFRVSQKLHEQLVLPMTK